jgi:hypothetical protein
MSLDLVWKLAMMIYEARGYWRLLALNFSYMQRSWAASTFACVLEVR